jgi:hypothetical protein
VKDLRILYEEEPISVAAPSKAWVCGCLLAGIAGSISAGGVDVCLLCCQVEVPVRAGHSSRGVLPSVMCPVSVIAKPIMGEHDPKWGQSATKKKKKRRRSVIH